MKRILFVLLLICTPALAEDVATYSGSVYTGCQNIGNTSIFLNDPNDYATVKTGYIYLANGCKSLPQVPAKHLKIVSGAVVEMTQGEKDAVDAQETADALASLTTNSRLSAKNSVDELSPEGVRLRAALLVTLDEVNILRQWLASFKTEVAASSNLADLKNRVATLPATADRTASQLKTAIKGKIDAGSAD